ncbi:MAG: GAF domain-containing protein, partial [Chloroflexi bacterium]|nr:GAF domain-containing protein [Chloroflexota bacterium]
EQDALQRLHEISVKILGQLELAPLLQSILQGVVELVGADKGQLFRYDPQRDETRSWVATGMPEEAVEIVYKPGDGLVGKVLDTGHPLRVDDYDAWEGRVPHFPKGIVGPAIIVAMKRGEEWLGVLGAARDPGKKPFTDDDLELLQLFANQAAVAISNARLYEEAKRSAGELSSLYDTSLEITRQLDLSQVLERIIQRAVELAKGNYGQFYLYDETRQELIPSVPYQLPEPLQKITLKPGEGLSGQALATRQPLVVNDYDSWEGKSPQVPAGLAHRGIAAPVEHGERVLGVLTVNRRKEDPPFAEADIRLLTLFANQAAVAIANARLYEETKRSAEELSNLYETSLELTRQLDLHRVLEGIIRRGVELARGRFGQLYLYDPSRGTLHGPVTYNLPESMQGYVIKPGEGMTGRVFVSREPMIVEDYDNWEGRFPQVPAGMVYYSAAIPVEHGEQVLGVFWVGRDQQGGAFTEQDIKLLTLLANQAAVAIANARLYEESKRSAGQLSSLYETSLELAGQLELDPLLQSIIKRVTDLLEADLGELYRYDPQRQELHPFFPIRLPDTAIVVMRPGEGVAGKVLLSGEPLRVDDYDSWEGRSPQWPIGFTGPALGVPVKRGDEFLGVITVGRNPGKRPFNEGEVELLQLYANQVAVAIANAQLYEETRKSAEELSSLYEASLEMASQLEPQKLLEAIVQRAMRLLGGVSSEIVLWDPQRQVLRDSVTRGVPELPTFFSQLALKPGEGLDGKVFASGQPMIIEDYNTWEGRVASAPYLPVPRIADVPIILGKETLGTLKVNRKLEDPTFAQDDLRTLTLLANQAAVAISNARLYEEAKQSAEELSRLYETSIDITKQLSVPKLLEAIMVRAAELLHGAGGIFFLYNSDTGKLHPEGMYKRRVDFPQTPLAPSDGLAGKIYTARQPMAVEDYDTWEGRSPDFVGKGLYRLAGAPMILGESCLGVIIVDRGHEDPLFNDEDLRLLTLFANQAAIAISNARLYEGTKRSAEELSSLYEASLEMASQLEPQKLLESIVLRAKHLLRGQNSEIVLYDPQKQRFRDTVVHGELRDSSFQRPDEYVLKPGEGIDGKVFATGQPMILDDYNTWEGRVKELPPVLFPRMVDVPIKLGKEILGTLKVTRRLEDPTFTQEDLRLLTLLANQAAIAFSNARLYEGTKRSAEELSSLYEASLEMASQLEPQKLLEAIVLRAERLLQAQVSGINLYDPQKDELRVTLAHGPIETFYREGATKPGEGIDGQVFASGRPMIIEDYNSWEGRLKGAPPMGYPHIAAAPIKLGEETIGTLDVLRKIEDPPFTQEDVRLLTLFANQAAIAISNARLYKETSRRAEELSTLYETSLELTGQLQPQKLLEAIALHAWRLLEGKVAEILLWDPQKQALMDAVLVSRGEFKPVSDIVTKPGQGIDGKVYVSGQPVIVEDYNAWEGRLPGVRTIRASRMAAVPIKHGEQILGTLKIRRFKEDPPFTPEDVRLLSLFANQAAAALTNARQYEELQKLYSQVQEKERLESELRVAHNIQASLLPHELPKIRGWELGAMWTAARVISGDFYDCFPVPGGKWGFVIADVAGKGIPAALFMALCRTLVRTFCMDGRPPQEAITRANDIILADAQSDWFVTLFYGLLDPKWGILTYVNAGHPPPLWYRRGTGETEGLKAEGIALGVIAGPKLEERSVQLEAGDLLLFYTDGLSEARDAQDRLFGERRIRNLLKKFAGERPSAFLTALQKGIAAFAQGRETSDDLTAILIKRAGK